MAKSKLFIFIVCIYLIGSGCSKNVPVPATANPAAITVERYSMPDCSEEHPVPKKREIFIADNGDILYFSKTSDDACVQRKKK